jgi:GNAT superfamily N-acetyltransferase
VRLRDARPDECDALSALAYSSKAHWGYDDAFMEACRDELTVSLDRAHVRVAHDGALLGFHGLDGDELTWLFVAPGAMGRGVGRALVRDACALARAAGIGRLRIEADPNAVGFYERMGASRVGEVASGSIPGRVLPVYALGLSSKT